MINRELVRHLAGVWLGFILAGIWWVFAHRSFVAPTYWRYEREGKEWPQFAMWTMDLAMDWPVNHHVWFWAAVVVTGALLYSRRQSEHQARLRVVARALSYGYIAILAMISISVAAVCAL
jgi:hypothetical protein